MATKKLTPREARDKCLAQLNEEINQTISKYLKAHMHCLNTKNIKLLVWTGLNLETKWELYFWLKAREELALIATDKESKLDELCIANLECVVYQIEALKELILREYDYNTLLDPPETYKDQSELD